MTTVASRELSNRLGACLNLVRSGETVEVGDLTPDLLSPAETLIHRYAPCECGAVNSGREDSFAPLRDNEDGHWLGAPSLLTRSGSLEARSLFSSGSFSRSNNSVRLFLASPWPWASGSKPVISL